MLLCKHLCVHQAETVVGALVAERVQEGCWKKTLSEQLNYESLPSRQCNLFNKFNFIYLKNCLLWGVTMVYESSTQSESDGNLLNVLIA